MAESAHYGAAQMIAHQQSPKCGGITPAWFIAAEIIWPSGVVQQLQNTPADQILKVVEPAH